jgi:hypothetical protein
MLLDAGRTLRDPEAAALLVHELMAYPAQLRSMAIEPLREFLTRAITVWAEEVAALTAEEPACGQLALRGLVEHFMHLLALGLLAEDADGDLHRGDGRLALLAARYARTRLGGFNNRPTTRIDRSILDVEEAVLCGRPVDVEYAERAIAELMTEMALPV